MNTKHRLKRLESSRSASKQPVLITCDPDLWQCSDGTQCTSATFNWGASNFQVKRGSKESFENFRNRAEKEALAAFAEELPERIGLAPSVAML